jgi:poly-gamma-glutamate capsule biosynthesis protein CapA/YwtB (metallophosphatase superfamily)
MAALDQRHGAAVHLGEIVRGKEQMRAPVEAQPANRVDDCIVSVHWGFELDTSPRAEDVEAAHAMIDAGADIIFGHHQHRMQPLEFIDGKPVFWGLGNFVWPHNSDASATTAVARAVVNPDGSIDACLIDAYIRTHGRPEITGEAECGPPV